MLRMSAPVQQAALLKLPDDFRDYMKTIPDCDGAESMNAGDAEGVGNA